jgi:outer membrane protein assembly factor BamB/class 3 adenylate cyclase
MTTVNPATTHGFLFADLRDYTRFVETRGDDAAAALLGRYRALVRAVIGEFGGAEIRTEGDSFYVVFPSASSAVLGGLAILAAAAEATRTDPSQPLRVGIGVHAGETAETGEGPVGSAVNIAARVCAQARAGELLVTDTVRSLTRTRLTVQFTRRGNPSLKGIREPISLFTVQAAAESIQTDSEAAGRGRAARMWTRIRARPAARWVLPGVAAAVVLIALLAANALLGSPKGSSNPSAITSLPPMADVPFYRVDAHRSSIYPGPGPVAEPQIAWQVQLAASADFVPIVVDGKVIVGDSSGILRALDGRTGSEEWRFQTDDGGGFAESAAAADGLIFVADLGGTLYGLDAATGDKRWDKPLPSSGVQPVVADGLLYVGSSDGHAYGFDPLTGQQRWDWKGPAGTQMNVSVVSDGVAYIGGGGVLYAIRLVDGAYAWPLVKTISKNQSAAVLAGETIFWAARPALGEITGGELLAIDRASGKVRWRWSSPSGQQVNPSAIRDGTVYVVTPDDGVYALRDKGTAAEQVWHAPTPGSFRPVSMVGDVLYIQALDGPLTALSVTDGHQLWRTSPAIHGTSNPVVTGGMIFQVDGGPGVIRGWAEPRVIALLPSPSLRPSATASPTGPPPAKFVWHATGPDGKLIPLSLARSPDGDIWATDPYNDRFAIFKPDGTFVEYWGVPGSSDGQFQLRRSNGDGFGGIAIESDGSFFVLDVGNGRVQKFDGQRRFVRAWGGFGDGPGMYRDPVGIAVAPDGSLYVLDDLRGVIERYDQDGKVLGSFNAFVRAKPLDPFNYGSGGAGAGGLAVDANGNLYVGDAEPPEVERFDPKGNLTMTFGSVGTGPGQYQGGPSGAMAIDSSGSVYVSQGPGRGASPGVFVFDRDGDYVSGFGATAAGPDQITWPTGLLLDGAGNLYVSDGAGQADRALPSWLVKFQLLAPLAP